ncbi:MAG: NADPH:quinone oxidoreductase family protein [Myxococcota bacterium]|jgi:NADPH:quinone reductase|nr:NADPH:quinone oxidoreductase family protein [Myxococcota bacterium]
MRVITCTELGAPENLMVESRPDLAPLAGHVLVDVKACGVYFVDTLMVQGLYQIRPDPPFVPGGEVAGVVRAVGEGVEEFSPGDAVIATPGLNGFAEQVLLPASRLIPMPGKLSFPQASGFYQAYCTAQFALKNRAELKRGETVLVLGAAGGVGLAAIDVARDMGARVIAAASSPEKLEACRRQGADEVILYSEEDLKLRAKELSGGGVDVVYDPVGGDFSEPALRAMAPGGRHLVIGFAGGEIPRVRWNLILLKQCQVVGVDWGGWGSRNREANAALFQDLADRVESGALTPVPPTVYPFEEAGQALRDLMDRRVVGKAALSLE